MFTRNSLIFSGSSSGDDLKRLNEIVTPPPMLDEGSHTPPPLPGSQQSKTAASENLLLAPSDDDGIYMYGAKEYVYPINKNANEDLNKATDEYLEKKKEEMDVLFESNRLKPGDEGYVYDKEVDFDVGPKMESGWDSDDTMSDF